MVLLTELSGDSPRGEAFTLVAPEPSTLPVLIAVPHAGRAYPPELVDCLRAPHAALLRLEDRLADRLAIEVAAASGAGVLVAHAPRALIDLNRAPDDVDWTMVSGGGRGTPGRRARSGLGLVPRRLPGIGELWRGPIAHHDLAARLAQVHAPYHAALAGALDRLRRRWGAALLLDLHSMPSLPARNGHRGAGFVLGDRFGASCHGRFSGAAIAGLAGSGHGIAHNRPYSGGYVLERHGDPRHGVHALQLEIDRAIYLDSRLEDPGEGWEGTVAQLVSLVRKLAAEVAESTANSGTSPWAVAAE